MAEPQRFVSGNQAITLRLYATSGAPVGQFVLKVGVRPLAVAGGRIFVLSGGQLKTIDRNGDVRTLGGNTQGVLPSPDGQRWLFSSQDSNGNTIHSQVMVAGVGMAPRVVADSVEQARALEPFLWTPSSVFIAHAAVGIGGYILFSPATGPVDRLDPTTWQVTKEPWSSSCAFSDQALNGTAACFPTQPPGSSRQVQLISAGGANRVINLPPAQFALDGDAYFDPSGTRLCVGGATGAGAQGQAEQFTTGLIEVATASYRAFGPSGLRPAMGASSWLPDGRLVLRRPPFAAGGPVGVYVVSPSGDSSFIDSAGDPIGVLP